jgi:hypothetical protein
MKRILLITILIVGLSAEYGFAQMGQGHMTGQGMMGPGMMGGGMMGGHMGGYGMMGPGMMGGYGMHPCMMGGGMMGSHMGGMMGPGMMGYGGYGMMGRGHMGGMMGPGMMGRYGYGSRGYDPEAYEKYQKEYQKYLDDTAGLRKRLHNKKFEYHEASRNSETKRDTILKLEKELRDLQWELYEKAPR